MENHAEDREGDHEKKSLMIFGRDVSKIPCFRGSCLYGFSGGIVMGILTFMFTSRVNLASHMVIGSTCAITLGYFTVCRYHYAREEILANQVKGLMHQSMILVGSERDEVIVQTQKLLSRDD